MKKIILCAICAICGFTAANAQGKFGHVNSQEIIQAMPEFTKFQADMKQLGEQYEGELKSMQTEFQKNLEEYDKLPENTPEPIKKRKEQSLQESQQKIQQFYQDSQQALNKEQNEKMQTITTKVLDAIKAVGQAGGYVYIMDTVQGIPYISTTLSTDVTKEVKAKLGLK